MGDWGAPLVAWRGYAKASVWLWLLEGGCGHHRGRLAYDLGCSPAWPACVKDALGGSQHDHASKTINL